MTETVKTYLRPIDRDGLLAFAEKGRNNPNARGTNKVHTVMEGQYRSLSYVGDHAAVVVDEPLHLFGQNTAPPRAESRAVRPGWLPGRGHHGRGHAAPGQAQQAGTLPRRRHRQPGSLGVRAAPRRSRPKWASRKCA